MAGTRGDWCRRLMAALADGRYAENPGPWQDHLATCDDCHRRAEVMMTFRDLVAQADREAGTAPQGPSRARQAIEEAFRRYEEGRRRRRFVTGGFVAVLVVCIAGVFLTRANPDPVPHDDPVAYARSLYDRIYPRGEAARYDLLGQDEALRDEYRRALHHPESLVRRTALQALLMSNVAVDPAYLEDVLRRSDETLEKPLEVATTGDAGRWIAEALDRRRVATLQSTLIGLSVWAANGRTPVSASVVERFFTHADPTVRQCALGVLERWDGYVPEPEVVELMRSDPSPEVRQAAGGVLIQRGTAVDREAVLDHLRSNADFDLEDGLLPLLSRDPASVAFFEQRVADPAVRPRTAMWHLYRLVRSGRVKDPPTALVERALHADDPVAVATLALVAVRADWSRYRGALQDAWREMNREVPGPQAPNLGVTLMRWDLASDDPARLALALEVAEGRHNGLTRPWLERLAACDVPEIRARAKQLLAERVADQ